MNRVTIFTTDLAKHTSLALVRTACFACSKIPDELVRCPVCNHISYCSIACFVADIDSHKKICAALRFSTEKIATSSDRRRLFPEWETAYELEPWVCMLALDEIKLFKKLLEQLEVKFTPTYDDLFMYDPRCAVCLRSADDMRSIVDPEYGSLLHCPDCRATFACSDDHRTAYLDEHCHKLEDGEDYTECEMNKRAYEHSLEIVTRGWTLTDTIWFPIRRKSEYIPLPSSWDEWFADPSNFSPPDSSPVLNRVRTFQLSIPMTVLYGMEVFDKSAGEFPLLLSHTRTELEIAVIGAYEYELKFGGLACFEEILHNLPSLRRLTVRFIGPGINNIETRAWAPCALCKENGVELVHSIHATFFPLYVNECTTQASTADDGSAFHWPDVAVMLNSGMGPHSVNGKTTWSSTLELLARNSVPTICTAYLKKEAKEDEDFLLMNRYNIVFNLHKNPWRSEVVTKMIYSWKGFFTYNGFIQGFRGKQGEVDSLTSRQSMKFGLLM